MTPPQEPRKRAYAPKLPAQESYTCEVCNYTTLHSFNLNKHFLSKYHLRNMGDPDVAELRKKSYLCEICNITLNSYSEFMKHNQCNKHLANCHRNYLHNLKLWSENKLPI